MTTITQLKEVKEISDEQLLALDTLEETLSLPLGSLKTFMEEYLNGKYARLAAENTFTQNNTMNGVLYFKNGNNTPAGINQGSSGQLYISATGGIDMTSPSSVTVPVPDNNDRSQKAAPTEWVLTQMGRLGGLPTGTIVAWSGSTAPDGWLLCNGGELSRTTYAPLYELLGVRYTPLPNIYKCNVALTGTTATLNDANFVATLDANGDYATPVNITALPTEDWTCIIPCYIHSIKGTNSCFFYGSDSSHCSILVCFDSSTLKVWMSSTYGTSWNVINGKASTFTNATAYTWYAVKIDYTANTKNFRISYATCDAPKEYGEVEDLRTLQYTECFNETLSADYWTQDEYKVHISNMNNSWRFSGEVDFGRFYPSQLSENEEKNSTFNIPNIKHYDVPHTVYTSNNLPNNKDITIDKDGWIIADAPGLGSGHVTINKVGQTSNYGAAGVFQNNNFYLGHISAGDVVNISSDKRVFFPSIEYIYSYIIKY